MQQMAMSPIPQLSEIPKQIPDFTAYLHSLKKPLMPSSRCFQIKKQYHLHLTARQITSKTGTGRAQSGALSRRIHACKCFRGKYWSLTVRQKSGDGLVDMPPLAKVPQSTGFTPNDSPTDSFLNSFKEICTELYKLIFPPERVSRITGIVVVTGGTGCGKSNVVLGLIDYYLRDQVNRRVWTQLKRRPHVVTYEDPIERDLLLTPEGNMKNAWVDYTPRQRDVDVLNMGSAIESALRQTPAVFYVGEVRDATEWQSLLEFAGTGHLVFTTSHAGSLVGGNGKTFRGNALEDGGKTLDRRKSISRSRSPKEGSGNPSESP